MTDLFNHLELWSRNSKSFIYNLCNVPVFFRWKILKKVAELKMISFRRRKECRRYWTNPIIIYYSEWIDKGEQRCTNIWALKNNINHICTKFSITLIVGNFFDTFTEESLHYSSYYILIYGYDCWFHLDASTELLS